MEILFRGKSVNDGTWVIGDGIHYPKSVNYKGTCWIDGMREKANDWVRVIPDTVGRYTGLTDKNGNRIFEGDIVQYHAIDKLSKRYLKRYFVDMDKERRGWWPFACGDGCGCCEEDTLYPGDCEIIGNIHDNPELLDEKHE